MPATLNDVRRIAMALPDVVEGICFGTPIFYLREKLMLRMKEDGETLVVKFPMDQREKMIDEEPHIFSTTDHYLNYPTILVSLPNVSVSRLSKLTEGAWRMVASKKQLAALGAGSLPSKSR